MMLATDLAVLDHTDGSGDAHRQRDPAGGEPTRRAVDAAYDHAVGRLDAMTTALSRPMPPMVSDRRTARRRRGTQPHARGRLPEGRRGGQGGDPGRRVLPGRARPAVRAATDVDALDVYRVLRTTNPSPYMYLLRFDGFDVVGSSPEAH